MAQATPSHALPKRQREQVRERKAGPGPGAASRCPRHTFKEGRTLWLMHVQGRQLRLSASLNVVVLGAWTAHPGPGPERERAPPRQAATHRADSKPHGRDEDRQKTAQGESRGRQDGRAGSEQAGSTRG